MVIHDLRDVIHKTQQVRNMAAFTWKKQTNKNKKPEGNKNKSNPKAVHQKAGQSTLEVETKTP